MVTCLTGSCLGHSTGISFYPEPETAAIERDLRKSPVGKTVKHRHELLNALYLG